MRAAARLLAARVTVSASRPASAATAVLRTSAPQGAAAPGPAHPAWTAAAAPQGAAAPGPASSGRCHSSSSGGSSSTRLGEGTHPLPRIGIIGAGQMGQALIGGWIAAGMSTPGRICASIKTFERRDLLENMGIGSIYGDAIEGGAREVAANSRIICIGVKPQAMLPVLDALAPHVTEQHLIISIAAGIRIATLESRLCGRPRVVRVMPNTPALVQSGASAYALGSTATPADADTVHALLSSVGLAVKVEERMMDAVTGLSGSGPAFVYLAIEALADGGVAAGLPRDTALALAAQTVAGAAKMVFSNDETAVMGLVHPGVLKDRVASPAGTTIAGLTELESSGVRGAFIRAVARAAQRSEELAG